MNEIFCTLCQITSLFPSDYFIKLNISERYLQRIIENKSDDINNSVKTQGYPFPLNICQRKILSKVAIQNVISHIASLGNQGHSPYYKKILDEQKKLADETFKMLCVGRLHSAWLDNEIEVLPVTLPYTIKINYLGNAPKPIVLSGEYTGYEDVKIQLVAKSDTFVKWKKENINEDFNEICFDTKKQQICDGLFIELNKGVSYSPEDTWTIDISVYGTEEDVRCGIPMLGLPEYSYITSDVIQDILSQETPFIYSQARLQGYNLTKLNDSQARTYGKMISANAVTRIYQSLVLKDNQFLGQFKEWLSESQNMVHELQIGRFHSTFLDRM